MPSLATIEHQVISLVDELGPKKQEKLLDHLNHRFFVKQLKKLRREVDSNSKLHPITDEEIQKEVELAREETHKNRC